MGKMERKPAWQLTKVKNKREVIEGMRGKTVRTLCVVNGSLSTQKNRSWNHNFRNTKVELHSEMTL